MSTQAMGGSRRFLCIGYFDPARMQALTPDAVEAVMRECPPHMDTLHATGRVAGVAGVENEARYLRLAGGKLDASEYEADGTRARIGCVFILEAADMEEAVQLAALHPTTQVAEGEHLGWYTEVRPIRSYFAAGNGTLGTLA